MQWLQEWLSVEAVGIEVYFLVGFLFLGKRIWAIVLYFTYKLLGYKFPAVKRDNKLTILSPEFPFLLFYYASLEEVVYRFLPIFGVIEIYSLDFPTLILVIIFTSTLFGIFHGGFHFIFSHGPAGIIYSVVFLKCGGFHSHYLKAFIVTTVMHVMWNASIAVECLIRGQRKF